MSAPAGGDKKNIVKMAYIYFQEGRWDKAIEEYKKLIVLDPEDINTHNMLGDVYVKKGSTKEAFEEYSKVSADFSSRGQSDKAAIVNKKIASLDTALLSADSQKKQSLIKQTLKAETAMEQGDVDSAIEALSEVLKMDTENLAAFFKLGELFEKKGQVADAVKQYQVLGAAFLKNRLYKKAQEMYTKVVQLDPSSTEAHISLAQIFVKQGSEGDAKKEYLNAAEQALSAGDLANADAYAASAVELKSIEAHYVLGMVLFKKQKLSEAKAEFESLLRFKVNHVGALTNLGLVLLELNQPDKAAENIQKALKIEKDNLVALEAWVEVSIKKGNKAEAVNNLMTLIDRYSAKNDNAKTAELARSVIAMDENSTAAYTKLADSLKNMEDKNGAADAYFKLVLVYEKQNKKDLVGEFLRKTLELNPGHSEAQKRMMGEVMAGAPPSPAAKAPEPASKTAAPAPKAPAGVLDLEQDAAKPFEEPPRSAPVPAAPPSMPAAAEKTRAVAVELDHHDDLADQMSIAENYLKQGLVEEAIEIYQQLAETHPEDAEIKTKLNQAYTAYVKTGEDVIGALEEEKKAKEEEDRRLRAEMEKKAQEDTRRLREELEQKARLEAEKQARAEFEKKAHEEAEMKAKEEMERLSRAEAEKRFKEEVERKTREEVERRLKEESLKKTKEEVERKVREELEKKARDEAERRIREEAERRVQEDKRRAASAGDLSTSRTPPPSKGDVLEENRDEFMTIAVADIYVRQGLVEEAVKIYHRIVQNEPNNLEAKKKLNDAENLIKSKGGKLAGESNSAAPSPSTSSVPSPEPSKPAEPSSPTTHPAAPEKDSGGKRKSNRVGYV
ncbi:MAG TPA: tetratricopeptide repeat protein [bacterium]|jgi:tetratricopeptide (TPR) repeat protein|nr:tetratricopeptide repeat protein [bacterium]